MALGYLADLALGDPRRGHPVAAFGGLANALERRLWRDHRGAGAAHTALCVTGALAAGALFRWAGHAPPVRPRVLSPSPRARTAGAAVDVLVTAAVTWSVLGGTGLARAARAVAGALDAGELARARALLPALCGRDPRALDAEDLARAVVESVAENTSDAVTGALLWGGLAGDGGLLVFRAVNTLDAMVGHRSPRHLRFGWSAARLDDLLGWPGARLTALLATVAAPDPRGALRAWRADAHRHPSPNAGRAEAAFAGALGLRLGGVLSYGGRVEHRPSLNAAGAAPTAADVERAVRLSRRVGALALAVSAAVAVLRRPPGRGRPGGVRRDGTAGGGTACAGRTA
ncbi:cobalamin biosynthesis protein [Streptomyces sp. AJS327]|uniref:cobalamin biosynthesis protein n=1 Tax=Streptomyces sp. AJS327 TaxID=2545265 RepID=UPI0035B5617F